MSFADWGKGYSLRWRSNYWARLLLSSLLIVLSLLFLFPSPVWAAPSIFPSVLPSGQVSVSYSTTLVAAPITPPATWAVTGGSLPLGLTLAAATGTISGTPTTAGTYTFLVQVTDTTGPSAQQGFSITVATNLDFLYDYLANATEAESYQGYTGATGGTTPYTFSLVIISGSGTLPSGLSLNSTSGVISGTPAKGTAGTYYFTIRVTDSSSPSLYKDQSYTLVVEKGYYDSVITISSTLAAGQANIYVDGKQVAKLGGGQTTRQSFAVGAEPDITVDPVVSHPTRTDVRFVADVTETTVDELSPNVTFTYHPEYYINLTTDPSQIASLTGSNWYKEGVTLRSTASAQIEGKTGAQYRFSYWLLPTGEKSTDEDLSWIVTAPGKAIATYDTYYQLTVISPQSKVTGSGWYKAGTAAQWSLNPPEVSMSGIFGLFLGKLKPDSATGTEVMDAPKTVTVTWHPDYTMPAVLLSLLFIFLIAVIFGVRRLLYPPPKPAVAPTPPAPAPPTIVVVGGAQKPDLETTREQLVEKFSEILQKYENEVKAAIKPELPEAKLIPESQRLAPPRRKTTCGHISKNLIRTVAGNWRKAEEKIQTKTSPKRKTAEKGISLVTVWARDIYNEWGISTCSLPSGHSSGHKGTTRIAYSLQNTITEERTYGAKEKVTPPKPHFTDELPVVDIARHEVIAEESASTNDVDTPYDVIPPEEQ